MDLSSALVLDNGGFSLRAGFAGQEAPLVDVPNTTARIKRQMRLLVADETEEKIKDMSQLQYLRPIERGYVTDTFVQSTIWERLLGPHMLNMTTDGGLGAGAASRRGAAAGGVRRDVRETPLVLTTAPFMPQGVEAALDELVFETHGFPAMTRATSAQYAARAMLLHGTASPGTTTTTTTTALGGSGLASRVGSFAGASLPMTTTGTGIIVDAGYSFTHVIPFARYEPVTEGIVRLDVGGKLLTSHLKELVSLRQWNVMGDTYMVNGIKERLCFVAQAFDVEVDIAKRLAAPAALKQAGKAAAAVATAGGGGSVAAALLAATAAAPAARSGSSSSAGVLSSTARAHAALVAALSSSSTSSSSASVLSSSSSSSSAGGAARPVAGAAATSARSRATGVAASSGAGGTGSERPLPAPSSSSTVVRCGRDTGSRARTRPQPTPPVRPPPTDAATSSSAGAAPPAASDPGGETDGTGIGIRREFVLPDYSRIYRGFVRGSDVDPKVKVARATAAATAAALARGEAPPPPAGASAGDDSTSRATGGAASGLKRKRPPQEAGSGAASDGEEDVSASDGRPAAGGSSGNRQKRDASGSGKKGGGKSKGGRGRGGGDDDDDGRGGRDSDDTDTGSMTDESDASGSYDSEDDDDDSDDDDDDDGGAAGGAAAAAAAASSGAAGTTATGKRIGFVVDADHAGGTGAAGAAPPPPVSGVSEEDMVAAGYDDDEIQVVVMNTERISVPEVLFQPALVGLGHEGGLPLAVAQAIAACPPALQPALWSSIILTGGNAALPGLEARLARELAPLAPTGALVQLYTPPDPLLVGWRGASYWAHTAAPEEALAATVTKAQYREEGHRACARVLRLPKRGSCGLWPVGSPMHDAWVAACEAEDAGLGYGDDYAGAGYYGGGGGSGGPAGAGGMGAEADASGFGASGLHASDDDDFMMGGGLRRASSTGSTAARPGRAAAAQAAAAISRTLA